MCSRKCLCYNNRAIFQNILSMNKSIAIVENHSENVQWIGGEPICSGVMCASFLLLESNFKQNDFSNRISYTSIYKLNGEENFV